jgi:hypothetical protein
MRFFLLAPPRLPASLLIQSSSRETYDPRLIGFAGGCVGAEVRPELVGLGVGARIAGPRVPLPRVPALGAGRPTLAGGGVTPRGGGRELRKAGVLVDESSRRAPLPRPGGIERVR